MKIKCNNIFDDSELCKSNRDITNLNDHLNDPEEFDIYIQNLGEPLVEYNWEEYY